jgi:hypothetical protein
MIGLLFSGFFSLDRPFPFLYIQNSYSNASSFVNRREYLRGGFTMRCPRGLIACALLLVALTFSVSEVMGADDVMVLRYGDGSTQRIKLDRESEFIRQIEFLEGKKGHGRDDRRGGHVADDVMVLRYRDGSAQKVKLERESEFIRQIEFLEGKRRHGHDDRRGGYIKVVAATYGGNCGASYGNVTNHLAEICDGKATCEYIIDFRIIGDPAPNCRKDYVVEWQCGHDPERSVLSIPPAAGLGERIILRCPVR